MSVVFSHKIALTRENHIYRRHDKIKQNVCICKHQIENSTPTYNRHGTGVHNQFFKIRTDARTDPRNYIILPKLVLES